MCADGQRAPHFNGEGDSDSSGVTQTSCVCVMWDVFKNKLYSSSTVYDLLLSVELWN